MHIFLTFGYSILTYSLEISKIEWEWNEKSEMDVIFDLNCSYLVICCIPDPRAFVLFNSALSCLLFSRVQMKMSILKRGLHETITIDLLVLWGES